jgi:hypothetical protein
VAGLLWNHRPISPEYTEKIVSWCARWNLRYSRRLLQILAANNSAKLERSRVNCKFYIALTNYGESYKLTADDSMRLLPALYENAMREL